MVSQTKATRSSSVESVALVSETGSWRDRRTGGDILTHGAVYVMLHPKSSVMSLMGGREARPVIVDGKLALITA